MDEIIYIYKPKKSIALLSIFLFGICSYFIGQDAISNTESLDIRGLILSPQNATILLWVGTIFSMLMTLIGFFLLYQNIFNHKKIILRETNMSAPKNGGSSKIHHINYKDISKLSITSILGNYFLVIEYNGKRLEIPKDMLPNKADFDAIYSFLSTKTL